jgi:hypothetical protein
MEIVNNPFNQRRLGSDCSYEDSLTGGKVFTMYCSHCHTNLSSKEYAKLMEFLWHGHDFSPPNPPLEPSPKLLIFSQLMNKLCDQTSANAIPPEEKPATDEKNP